MDGSGIDLCATASQKGIGAPPGLAILVASNKALEFIRKRNKPIPGWYASLSIWDKFNKEQADFQPYSITLAVNLVFALKKSLEALKEEGFEQRHSRHQENAAMLRKGLKELGLNIYCDEKEASPVITVVRFRRNSTTINHRSIKRKIWYTHR